jgi:hypothetical protein
MSDHVGPIAKLDEIQFVSGFAQKHVLVKLCVEILENCRELFIQLWRYDDITRKS